MTLKYIPLKTLHGWIQTLFVSRDILYVEVARVEVASHHLLWVLLSDRHARWMWATKFKSNTTHKNRYQTLITGTINITLQTVSVFFLLHSNNNIKHLWTDLNEKESLRNFLSKYIIAVFRIFYPPKSFFDAVTTINKENPR